MSKTPPPRRKLVAQSQGSSVTSVCIACAWRKTSNAGLRFLRENNADFPESYSGILAGFREDTLVLSQFHDDRQVGFIAVPFNHIQGVVNDIIAVYEQQLAKYAAEEQAALDVSTETEAEDGRDLEQEAATEEEENEDDE